MSIRKLALGIALLVPGIIVAQTGPGGVGDKDGTTSLKLWLDADSATVNVSDEVTGWDNLVDVTQLDMSPTTANNPNFVSSKFNGHAAISFEDVDDALGSASTLDYSYFPQNQATTFTVTQHDNMSQTSNTYATEPLQGNRFSAHMPWGGTIYHDLGACCGGDARINYTYDGDWLTEGSILSLRTGGGYSKEAWRNNVSQATGTTGTSDFTTPGSYTFEIGQTWSGNHFNGDVAEFLMFNTAINDAQMVIVHNYLAAKYNFTISEDYYLYENSHGTELVGIGQKNAESHTESKSANILTIKDPTALGDDEYVFMGHDNGDASGWTSTEIMDGDVNLERISREWRVDVTGTPGTVTLSIDPSDLPAAAADYDFYLLWVDDDGDFSSGATALPLTQNGAEFEATGVTLTDGQYITISTFRPEISFVQTAFSGFETTTPASFQVSIDYAVDAAVTVNYTTSGTADEATGAGTFTIAAGATTSNVVDYVISNSDGFESDETIILTLTGSSQSHGILGDDVSTYTIYNSDGATSTVFFDTPVDYTHVKTITIDSDMVDGSTDLVDFPVMIRVDGTDFTEMEPNIQSANGYDIRFTYENDIEWLDHQIELFDATNDVYIAWVRLPLLSATVDTKIEMYYGLSGASDPSSTAVFGDDWEAVYHLEGTTDGSNNGNNGSLLGDAAHAAGYIGNGLTLDGTGDYLEVPSSSSLIMTPADGITLSAWYQGTDTQGEIVARMDASNGPHEGYSMRILAGELSLLLIDNWSADGMRVSSSSSAIANNGSWHYLVATYDGSATAAGVTIYIDGEATTTDVGQLVDNLSLGDDIDPGTPLHIGRRGNNTGNWLDGEVDEARVIRRELSAEWIKTEFNNMSDAGILVTMAAATTNPGLIITESTDTVSFVISLSSTVTNDVNVDYAITGGTAIAGNDVILASGTATITANTSSTVITADLNDDAKDEDNENVIITLSNPLSVDNISLGTANTVDFTISDDDAEPEISLSQTSISINEGSEIVYYTVELDAASGRDVTVDYTPSAGTATADQDYIHATGTLTIPADSISAQISFNVINDTEIETQETFDVTLSNPGNATLNASFDDIQISINDNDNLGYDGPAGVGSKDGSGTLTMWYIADSATVSAGSVTDLPNLVGITDYDMVTPASEPDFVDYFGTGTLNGHAEISFNNVEDVLATNATLSAATFPYNEASSFIVTKHDNMSQRSNTYGTSTSQTGGLAGNRFSTHLPWNNNWYFDIGNCCGSTARVNAAYDGDWVGEYGIFSYIASSDDGKSVYRNNNLIGGPIAGTSNFTNHTNNYFTLGQSQTNDFQGDIVEFLLYTRPVNEAQRVIINNYLAAKYDLTISDDFYDFQASHAVDVAGIGQTSSESHVAAKSGPVTVSSPADLNDDEWVIFGHENSDITTWNTSDIPSSFSNLQRVTRNWRADVTGSPGSVSIVIEDSELPTLPMGYTEYVIIVDQDGLDWTDATVYPASLVDGEYVANDIVISSGTYFTVGTHIRTIEFVGNSLQDFENINNTISLSVSLQSSDDIVIPYTISGTATGGADYTITAGNFTIPAENTNLTIDLGIIDEAVEESDETVILTLGTAPTGTILGTNDEFTYTINDDDNDRSVNFDIFDYSRQVTINGSEVTGTHTDFPVLISYTHSDLRTVANMGNVENDNGYDIAFYDSLAGDWLDHHLEYYVPTTGEIVAWVRIPSLEAGTDVEIWMFYGNDAITFDQSSTETWDSNYQAVWHMGSDNYEDGTSNNLDGVDQGAADAAGVIGRAASFDGTSNVKVSDVSSLTFDRTDSYTISAWYRGTDNSSTIAGIVDDNANGHGYDLYISSGNGLVGWQGDNAGNRVYYRDNDAINDDVWHYLVLTYDGTNGQAYVDANTNNTTTQTVGTIGNDISPGVSFTIGSRSSGAAISAPVIGLIDEVRVSNSVRSADWITTEFNNQTNPGTFVTVSATQNITDFLTLDETVGQVTVTVRVDPIDETQATTIDFDDQATGTALIGDDFTITGATLNIPTGSRTGTFTFDVINDLQDEVDETFTLELSNPSANAKLGESEATFTIQDDDDEPTIEFVATVSSVNEGTAAVTIGVILSAESGNDVTVEYAENGGSTTVVAGDDYIAIPAMSTVTVPAGDLSANIIINIIDDTDIEVLEDLAIDISNPTNATLGANTTHIMTVNDNDDLGFNGPGGVGEVDGSKTLKLWLAADSAQVAAMTTNVTNWDNSIISVTGLDFTPATGAFATKVDNAINGHAEISFDNENDVLVSSAALSASTFPYNEATFFIVTRSDNLSQQSNAYSTATAATGAPAGTNITADIPGTNNVNFEHAGITMSDTYEVAWANGEHNIFAHRVTSDTSVTWRNNAILRQDGTNSNNFTNHSSFNFYIGREETDPFQGDIAEIIMFTRPIFDTQADIISNYLAAKYGLTISNDKYVFDNTHGNEVAGIGQTYSTDQHIAAEAGVITISNASDLDNDEYVLFGHDGAGIDAWVTNNAPTGDSIRRVAREWRFDVTNDPGTITIAIDADELPSLITGYQDYVVFVDQDGDFSSGVQVYQTTFVDGQYKATEVPIASGDYVTIGIIIRTIEFDVTSSNDFESNNTNVVINLNYQYPEDIEIDYQITGGTAVQGTDYSTATTGTIDILAGQTTAQLSLGINNDSDVETDETIILILENPPAGFRIDDDTDEHTYTINDDDNARDVQFNLAASGGTEDVGMVSLQVDLSLVDNTNPTTVEYAVTGGTAEAAPNPDYTFTAGTLNIPATQTSGTINFDILDDVLSESTETIEISLSSPTNANLGTNLVHTYSITDNEGDIELEFQEATTTIDEGGSIAQVVVELAAPSGQDLTIDYAINGGSTATGGGTDYALADGTLTISAGDQIETINVALTDDSEEEAAETIIIDLSNPSTGASLGTEDQHTITIVDNDALFGFYGPGGIGDFETNILWLDAENINGKGIAGPADGASVSTWVDRSGNGYDFDAIDGGAEPTYDAAGLNNNGTVVISSTDDGFRSPVEFTNSLSNYTFFSVLEQASGDYFIETNTVASNNFRLNQGAGYLYYLDGASNLAGNGSTDIDLMTWVFDAESGSNTAIARRDGTQVDQDNGYSVMSINNNFSIGGRYTGESVTDFEGNVSEVIVFNRPLNVPQQNIVENYLAAKYELTINPAIDFFDFDITHGNDVVGIGQDNTGEQHLQSMSDSLLIISGASALDDGDYVLVGHDGGAKNIWTNTEVPGDDDRIRRIEREWRMTVTGTPGTVIIKIDTTQLPTPPLGYDQYVVWIDEDGDFRSNATTYQVEYSPIFGFHVSDEVTIADEYFIALGVGETVVEFQTTLSDGGEATANPSIPVVLNFVMGTEVTVDYEVISGSATGGNVDYLLASGTVTFPIGQTTANIIPGIIDDGDLETDEDFVIELSNQSSNVALGDNTQHTYTIHDNDNVRDIEFSATSSSADEDVPGGMETITVTVSPVNTGGATSVDLQVVNTGNFATLTDDYTLSTTTVTVPINQPSATFDINIVDDGIFENAETVTLELTNPIDAQLGSNDEYVFTINDDDTSPSIEFTTSSSFTSETSSTAFLEVQLSTVSVVDATVSYSVTAGSATNGADYTLADGTLTVLAGNLSENILIDITDDLNEETAETIEVTLSAPVTGCQLGSTLVHTLTITDNDVSGGTGAAGIGDNTSNLLWLRGDNYSAGTWTDISGNSNNMVTAGANPTANGTNANFNNQATVTFDGNDYLDAAALSSAASDFDIFYVLRSDGTTSNQVLFEADDTQDLRLGFENDNGAFEDQSTVWSGSEIMAAGTNILQYNLESGVGQADITLNDGNASSSTYALTGISGTRSLGALSGGANGFAGDIAEVIVYNFNLNDAQRIIALNYMASRYGVDINSVNTLDRFAYDDASPAEDIFYYDLVGIGREDVNNFHVQATSDNLFTLKNPNDLEDGEYLLIANDGTDDASWVGTEVPNASTTRLTREWRTDMTGDIGTITIEVDNSQLPANGDASLSLAIMTDADGDFTSGATYNYLSPIGGDLYSIDNFDLSTDQYFTFALVAYATTGPGVFNSAGVWTTNTAPSSSSIATISAGDAMTLAADVTVGSLIVETGASLDLNGFNLSLGEGCITLNGGTIDVSDAGSTISYINPNAVEQCITSMTYNNLATYGNNGSTKYLLGDITVQGDMTMESPAGLGAIFDSQESGTMNDHNITLAGDWSNEVSFLPRTGTVTFNGTDIQYMTNSTAQDFYNLTVNSTSDTAIVTDNYIAIENELSLTDGVVANDNNVVVIENAAVGAITASSADSFVNGVMSRETNSAVEYEFPVGYSTDWKQAGIIPGDANANTFLVQAFAGDFSSEDFNSSTINNVSEVEYWDITQSSGSSNGTVLLYWSSQAGSGINDPAEVMVGQYVSSQWETRGGANGANYVAATQSVSSFGTFTFVSNSEDFNPLPVELLYLEAEPVESGIVVSWATASEEENDFFILEHSMDGIDFSEITRISGQGTSNTIHSYQYTDQDAISGTNYYRLVQVDFDGTSETHGPVSAIFTLINKSMSFDVYPNPTSAGNVNISLENISSNQPMSIEFYSVDGRIAHSETLIPSLGTFRHQLKPRNIGVGVYQVILKQADKILTQKIIIN